MEATILSITAGLIGAVGLLLLFGISVASYNSWKEFKRNHKYYKTMNGPKT
jgi:CHASE3 domain sensor protein